MKLLAISMDNTQYGSKETPSRSHEVRVAEEFCRQGHDVTLVVERQPGWTPESPQPEKMEVLVAPVNRADRADAIGRGLKGDFDAAFASSVSGAPILAAWRLRHPNAPAVISKRVVTQVLDVPLWRIALGPQGGPWFESWKPWFVGLTAMDRIIANTNQTQDDLAAVARLYDSHDLPPTQTVYYGIDTITADAAVARNLTPPELEPYLPSKRWCVSASRLVPYKGVDLGIAALSLVPESERPAFAVIGMGDDYERLLHFARLAGTNAVFSGPVGDETKFEIIKGANFGLYLAFNPHIPSQFPIECVYAGRPCLASDIPINVERFSGAGDAIRFVNPFDTRAVADAIREIASKPPSEKSMNAAQEWIKRERSFSSHAQGVLEALGAS